MKAASDTPAQDLGVLSSRVLRPRTSYTELGNVLVNSTGSQPFINNHESQAGATCVTSAVTTKAVEDNQSRGSWNNVMTSDPIFPFEMPPFQRSHVGSLMDFPFDLGIGGDHVEDSRANNSLAQHPDSASLTVPLQQVNVGFAEENNMMVDFGAHHQNSFPFDISPHNDRISASWAAEGPLD